MNNEPSPDAAVNVAQELGADPAAGKVRESGQVRPLAASVILRDLTATYPLAMLGLAFIAGAAFAGRRRR
jgi:hypothetical protein